VGESAVIARNTPEKHWSVHLIGDWPNSSVYLLLFFSRTVGCMNLYGNVLPNSANNDSVWPPLLQAMDVYKRVCTRYVVLSADRWGIGLSYIFRRDAAATQRSAFLPKEKTGRRFIPHTYIHTYIHTYVLVHTRITM